MHYCVNLVYIVKIYCITSVSIFADLNPLIFRSINFNIKTFLLKLIMLHYFTFYFTFIILYITKKCTLKKEIIILATSFQST